MRISTGKFRFRDLFVPKNEDVTRPTSNRLRQALFNICQYHIEGARFLDLFAGSGAMGFEALSRGAATATFIDNSKEAFHCIQRNIDLLGVKQETTVLLGDAAAMLKRLGKQKHLFDIIYIDPPYRLTLGTEQEPSFCTQVLRLIDKLEILQPEGFLFIERAKDNLEPIPADLQHLHLYEQREMGKAALEQYRYKNLIKSLA
ncbi:MAG: hypothetical protein K0S74_567 [Chlamydiales bacterium]|jgi:16S rRNA (guanine966-N2)-methyltransferase|nr:hypothetical protein [Chlamydiales bacterium]